MSQAELDAVQNLFERGDVMDAASAIRELQERASASNDFLLIAQLDSMTSQMRGHLAEPELRQFDARLAGNTPERVVKPPARPQEPQAINLGRVSWAMIRGWVCCLLIAIGAFGPWAKTVFGASASGLDGSNDGWIMLVGALAAAGLLVSFIHDPDRSSRVLRSTLLVLIGLGLMIAGIYDWRHVNDVLSKTNGLASVGWGLELCTIAAAGLALNSALMLGARPRGRPKPDERTAL